MTASAILDAMVQTGNQIDSQWSMYIVVHLGLFWFFFLVHRPLLFVERAVALFAYGAFIFINRNALLGSYHFLEALRGDLVSGFQSELAAMPQTAHELTNANFADRDQIVMMTHAGALIVVTLFLLFRNVMIRRYDKAFPQHAHASKVLYDK